MRLNLYTVGPGRPEELIPLECWSLGHILSIDQVSGVKYTEVGELLRQAPSGPLQLSLEMMS